MKTLENNLKETKKELVGIFESYDDEERITEDFLYLFVQWLFLNHLQRYC